MRALRISPSQIKSWKRCPRVWAWPILGDVPREPPSGPALVGDVLHGMAEAWLKDGTEPDEDLRIEYQNPRDPTETIVRYPGRILMAGIHLLPPPTTPGLEIECEAHFSSPATVWKGRIDFRYPHPSEEDVIVVNDHKSTGSLTYALDPEPGAVNRWGENVYMGDDPQALIYAADAFVRYGARAVDLNWIYYETTPKTGGRHRSKKVGLRVLREEVGRGMEKLEATAELIQAVYKAQLSPLDLPPVPGSCKAFGGCDFKDLCNLTAQEKLKGALMSQNQNVDSQIAGLLAELQGGAGPTAIGNVPPPPPPPPAATGNPPPPPPPPAPEAEARFLFEDAARLAGVAIGDVLQFTPSPEFILFLANGQESWSIQPCGPHFSVCVENDAQAYLRAKGERSQMIANAAWEGATVMGTDPINPPEAPPNTPGQPSDAPQPHVATIEREGLDLTDRAAVKAYLVQESLVESGARFGLPRLLTLLLSDDDTPPPVRLVPTPPPSNHRGEVRAALDSIRAALDLLAALHDDE